MVHGNRGRVRSGAIAPSAQEEVNMSFLSRLLTAADRVSRPNLAHAHCDLPCGVYDPAQARIEAESVKAIAEKYQANTDPEYRTRAIFIKEQRAELVKHHLWVLWTDYFKPPHFEKYPNLNQLFNEATKLAGASGVKGSMDPAVGDQLLGKIEEISKIFWETKQA
jgi:nickel superoxide dismutase